MAVFGVVETFRGKTKGRVAGQAASAVRVFSVAGTVDPESAMALVTTETGVDINTPYDSSADGKIMLCQSMIPTTPEFNLTMVTCNFQVSPVGYFLKTGNPLNLPMKVRWKSVVESPSVDRDIDNNPILNSACDPPSSPFTRKIFKEDITLTKNKSFYDYENYRGYKGVVNTDTIQLNQPNGGYVTFTPGSMYIANIEPERDFTELDTVVPIVTRIEAYDLTQFNTNLTDPFQIHFLDEGPSGWSADTGSDGALTKLPFYAANGETLPQDTLLDGYGKPINSTIVVGKQLDDPVGTGGEDFGESGVSPTGATRTMIGSGDYKVCFLKYNNYKPVAILPFLQSFQSNG